MTYKEFFCYAKNDFCEGDDCDNCDLWNGKGGEDRDVELNDFVHVVRCKDCKCAKPEKGYFVCDYQSAAVLPDWYCWNGERKDDERNI